MSLFVSTLYSSVYRCVNSFFFLKGDDNIFGIYSDHMTDQWTVYTVGKRPQTP